MVSELALLALAFGAGMASFLNPCGFALLPGYVSYYFDRAGVHAHSRRRSALQGAAVGGIATLGFATVFVAIGSVVALAGNAFLGSLPWVNLVIGFLLIALGAALFAGKMISLPFKFSPKARLPATEHASHAEGKADCCKGKESASCCGPAMAMPAKMSYPSFYLYGVGYATASTSCTLPVFLLVVATALSSGGILLGVAAFAAYAIGKGALMIAVTVATATSKTLVVDKLRSWSHRIPKISGIVLVAAGIYLAYYQLTNYILAV